MYASFFKRPLDIVCALAALLVLSPLLLLSALLIVLDDGWPVFFRQTRVGRQKRSFVLFKFRSMTRETPNVASADAGAATITRVGGVLRRLNVDELPQLINILRGDMSVVGPRPALAAQQDLIDLRDQGDAYFLRPGLTGLAQVSAYDGMPVAEKAACDNRYARKVTFIGDVSIVLRTVAYLFRPPPVY